MAKVIFNQSGAELRIQDGGTHESAIMLENSSTWDRFPWRQLKNQYVQGLVVLNSHGEV